MNKPITKLNCKFYLPTYKSTRHYNPEEHRRFIHVYVNLSALCKVPVPLHAMEALEGEEVQLLLILYLGTRWG
jgi:hypothetical protein